MADNITTNGSTKISRKKSGPNILVRFLIAILTIVFIIIATLAITVFILPQFDNSVSGVIDLIHYIQSHLVAA
ncbi:MAG: hypothetical protein LBN22_11795 [Clostridiales Family XIII bacterium]|jgi:hypothetical protein|nr:hypothetical protein [Clostridiales Family XIII bacterium]